MQIYCLRLILGLHFNALLRIASPTSISPSKPITTPKIKVDRVGYAPTPGDFQSPASTKLASDPKYADRDLHPI